MLVAHVLAAADERLASPIVAVVFLVLGPLVLYGAYAAWTGRWRDWASAIPNVPLTLFPSVGLMLVGSGIFGVFPSTVTAVIAAPFFIVGLAGIPMVVFVLLDFDWFGPRWYREEKRTDRRLRREERAQRREKRARRKHAAHSAASDPRRDT